MGFNSDTPQVAFSLWTMRTPRSLFTTPNPKLITAISESACEPESRVPPIGGELEKDGWKNSYQSVME